MKKIVLMIMSLLAALGLQAAPISGEKALKIATDFFADGTRTSSAPITLVWSGNSLSTTVKHSVGAASEGSALLYIFNRGSNGFVIVAGDDSIPQPIIAYSKEREFTVSNMAPATRAIIDAWGKQIEAARNGDVKAQQMATSATTDLLYDTALWSQGEPYNREAPILHNERSLTGCVATAMAIIAYHNKWPDKGEGTTPQYSFSGSNCEEIHTVPANTLGRTYDYNSMLSNYNNGYTETQANAVAALMKDMGTSVYMAYHPEASGSTSSVVPIAFAKYFKYSKSSLLITPNGKSVQEWTAMLQENVATYGPTFFSGVGAAGGHAFVIDGFNKSGYFHINYGWGGANNDYYYLPNIEFYAEQTALFYLEPDPNNTSTYRDYITLSYFLDNDDTEYRGLYTTASKIEEGKAIPLYMGAIVNSGITDFNGHISLAWCDKNGAPKKDLVVFQSPTLSPRYLIRLTTEVECPSNLAEGDRLRLFYKGQYSNDKWEWMQSSSNNAWSEIILKASPEEIASSLELTYSKSDKTVSLSALMALQITVTNADGAQVAYTETPMSKFTIIDVSEFDGEYTFSIASGGEPYNLVLQF